MLVTCRQMQEMEARAFAAGVNEADLMKDAGQGIANVVRQIFPCPGTLILYLGSGHNAGDALVAAHELQADGWQIQARLSTEPESMKPLPQKHWRTLRKVWRLTAPPKGRMKPPLVLLDGLLGIGGKGPLRPHLRELTAEMNALRLSHGAITMAMDIPTGLDGDAGVPEIDCVVADITATVAMAKQGLVADAAIQHVGRLALVPLPKLTNFAEPCEDRSQLLTPELLHPWLPRRAFDFHKGQAGRIGILAGSRGYYGAAELACRGALRAGAGLVTLIVKEDAYDILAQRVPPEIMVKPLQDYREVLEMRFDALAIGPGLGFIHKAEYLDVIAKAHAPAVVDADALTALAPFQDRLLMAPAPRLLTPHPGEMARLMPEGGILCRGDQAETWAAAHPGHTLLLKGARTVIATQGEETLFNTTGHPGMATGGMGDVLTGVSAALLAQSLSPHSAAGLAAWLCGRAAELHAGSQAQEGTLPSDVISRIGEAWQEVTRSALSVQRR